MSPASRSPFLTLFLTFFTHNTNSISWHIHDCKFLCSYDFSKTGFWLRPFSFFSTWLNSWARVSSLWRVWKVDGIIVWIGKETAGTEPDTLLPFIPYTVSLAWCQSPTLRVRVSPSYIKMCSLSCNMTGCFAHFEPFIWKLNTLNCCHNVLVLACSVQQNTLLVFVVF